MDLNKELVGLIISAKRDEAVALICSWAEENSYLDVAERVLVPALELFGKYFSSQEQTPLSQGYVAAKVVEDVMNIVKDKTYGKNPVKATKGPVVIGNIEDDFHSLGRKIVIIFLEANGWKVIDLGNDVLAGEFVKTAVENEAKIIGVSAMMYTTAENIIKVREEIDRQGLTGKLHLAVGGAVFISRPELVKEVGGDGTSQTAMGVPQLFDDLTQRSIAETS
jgi:methanogenic corrinoid protein MtbC1